MSAERISGGVNKDPKFTCKTSDIFRREMTEQKVTPVILSIFEAKAKLEMLETVRLKYEVQGVELLSPLQGNLDKVNNFLEQSRTKDKIQTARAETAATLWMMEYYEEAFEQPGNHMAGLFKNTFFLSEDKSGEEVKKYLKAEARFLADIRSLK